MMKHLNVKYRLLVYLNSFNVCSGDIKKSCKKALKNFQSFFFSSPELKALDELIGTRAGARTFV